MSTFDVWFPNTGVFDGYLEFEACLPGLIGVWYSAYIRITDGPIGVFMAVFPPNTPIESEGEGAIYTRKFHPNDPPMNDRIEIAKPGTYILAYRGLKSTPKLLDAFFTRGHSRQGHFFITITDWDFGPGKTRPVNPDAIVLKDLGAKMPDIKPIQKPPCSQEPPTTPIVD